MQEGKLGGWENKGINAAVVPIGRKKKKTTQSGDRPIIYATDGWYMR
jgi:hypothetical protein